MLELLDLKQRFLENTKLSKIAFEKAQRVIPGGVQGNIKFFSPYPLSFAIADGAWMTDVDGNRYVDYLLSFGALMLGHGHVVVRQAVNEVWNQYGTTSFGVPYALETTMVESIRLLYPSIESVRFTNSGLEATLLAIRLGLAFTGKTHIAKFDGHYHGGHEQVLVNTVVSDSNTSCVSRPTPHSESLGLPDYYVEHTVVLPFNNLSLCEEILREQQKHVGVMILEPVQDGYIPATPAFMQGIRKLATELGIVLIFDEVKTGFRVALGGAQEYYGVRPDLTTLGKVLGGGFPIGAVGGKFDILQLSSPQRSRKTNEVVFHSGTFNGNPISLTAGLRTIEFLREPGRFEQIVDTTNFLKREIIRIAKSYNFGVATIGVGTIFNILVSENTDLKNCSVQAPSRELREILDLALMYHGVFSKPFNRFSVSAAHGTAEIQHTLDAFEKSFADMREVVQTKVKVR